MAVIVGGTGASEIRIAKFVGPVVPSELMAVTANVVFVAEFGVPVSKQEELSDAHPGSPVAVQVGAGVPLTTNWKE